MSSQTRASGAGGGGGRQAKKGQQADSNHKKSDHHGKPADKDKNHVKAETRTNTEAKSSGGGGGGGSDDPKMREKVAKLMETTQRSEDDVCCALYECDNDLDRAVIFLLETLPVVSNNSFFINQLHTLCVYAMYGLYYVYKMRAQYLGSFRDIVEEKEEGRCCSCGIGGCCCDGWR